MCDKQQKANGEERAAVTVIFECDEAIFVGSSEIARYSAPNVNVLMHMIAPPAVWLQRDPFWIHQNCDRNQQLASLMLWIRRVILMNYKDCIVHAIQRLPPRAHGVLVSRPLSMREALGSIPNVSIFVVLLMSIRMVHINDHWWIFVSKCSIPAKSNYESAFVIILVARSYRSNCDEKL